MKMHTVFLDGKAIFGPVADNEYTKIQEYFKNVPVAEKYKYKIVASVVDGGQPSAEKSEVAPVGAVKADLSSQQLTGDTDFLSNLQYGTSSKYFVTKDGKTHVRILPVGGVSPVDWKTPYPFVKAGFHSKVGLSMGETVVCPKLTFGRPCPVCNWSWNLFNSSDPSSKDLSKKIRGYIQIFANVIDLGDVEKGVQVYKFGVKLAEKIISYRQDPEYGDILHPDTGRNFIIDKKTKDNYPNYDDSRPELKVSSVNQVYPTWKAECKDLAKEIVEKSFDELTQVVKDTKNAVMNSTETYHQSPAPAEHQAPAGVNTVDGVMVVDELNTDQVMSGLEKFKKQ